MSKLTAVADWMIIIACPLFLFDIFYEPSLYWLQFTALLFVISVGSSAIADRIRARRQQLSDTHQPRDE